MSGDTAELLRALAKAKATFQGRAIAAAMGFTFAPPPLDDHAGMTDASARQSDALKRWRASRKDGA